MLCILTFEIEFNQELLNDVILVNGSRAEFIDLTIEQIFSRFILPLAVSQFLQLNITRIAIESF